jgi:hypothetical protein
MTLVVTSAPESPFTLGAARRKLLALWSWSALPTIVVLIQTFGGRYGTSWPDVLLGLSWLCPLISPLIGLMVEMARIKDQATKKLNTRCNVVTFRWSYWLSVFLLVTLTAVLLAKPFIPLKIQDVFALTSIALSIVSGLLTPLIMKAFVD